MIFENLYLKDVDKRVNLVNLLDGFTLVILTKVNTMEKELSKILMDILAVASGSTAIKQEKELVPFLISQHTLVS